jgi:hypothetical protein
MSYFFRHVHPSIAFPSPLTIAVIGDLSPAIAGSLGNLKAISPEEPRHALIFAIARDIDAGLSDADLRVWKNLAVSAIITFKAVATDDELFWLSTNAREAVGAHFDVVYFSAALPCSQIPAIAIPSSLTRQYLPHTPTLAQVQRIFQLATYMDVRELTTSQPLCVWAPDFAIEFNSKVSISSGEAVTKDYIDSARATYDRIFEDDSCRHIVLSAAH